MFSKMVHRGRLSFYVRTKIGSFRIAGRDRGASRPHFDGESLRSLRSSASRDAAHFASVSLVRLEQMNHRSVVRDSFVRLPPVGE